MKRIVYGIIVSLIMSAPLYAQNEMDALRFSMTEFGGSARFTSMGGAFGALGGDFSVLSTNPAGLGIYRSSEFVFSPSMGYHSIESTHYGTVSDDMKYNMNLGSIGYVYSIKTSENDNGGWRFVNLGFGINRHNNFNNRWIAEGFNRHSSLMTSFLEQARREGSVAALDDFTTGLAWDTYLLDRDANGFFVDMENGQVMQRMEMNSSGSIREVVLSLGANYNDRLYLGATLGLPSVSYEQNSVLSERDNNNLSPYFNSLTYTSWHETKGRGYQVKIGAIAWLTEMVRLGAAVHTPGFLKLEDEYRASMRSDLTLDPADYPDYDENAKFKQSPNGYFNYELTTPLRAIGSLGLVFGKSGLVSLDYEYTDHTKARLRSDSYSFSDENNYIRNRLSSQHILRAGTELRMDPFVLRAGYAHHTSPYRKGVNDASKNILSAGIGFRGKSSFIDFAYSFGFYSESYVLYQLENEAIPLPTVNRDFSNSTYRVTLGWRF